MPRMDKLSSYRTTVSRGEDGVTRVIYHNTAIVSFDGDSVTLNTGGWDTVTTRRKMVQAARQFSLPYTVFRKAGVTLVKWRDLEPVELDRRATFSLG